MSDPDPIAVLALIISFAALGLAVFQVILTVLQVTQQFVATTYNYRYCSKQTVGGWSRRSSRRFILNELRFEVLFTIPIISVSFPASDSMAGRDIYAVPTTRLDAQTSNEKIQESASTTNLSSSRSDSVSSSGAQFILHTSEGNETYTSSQMPWFLDLTGTRPEAKCSWLTLLNNVSIAHLQIDINERLLSYDFMPDAIKKPLAQMDQKSFLTLMSLFQVLWQEGQGGKGIPTGAGPYCEVTSYNLVNFGTVISYQPTHVQPTKWFYIVSEKARAAMFNRFDLPFHVVLTHSADEVYKSVLALAGDQIANKIRSINISTNGVYQGVAEMIGCFAEPEMPKAIEHGRDTFISIFSARPIRGGFLTDRELINLLSDEEIWSSERQLSGISEWARDYIHFSSHQPLHDGVRLPTDQLLATLQLAARFVNTEVHERKPISWSDSRKALAMIRLLDKQLNILCRLLAPTQPELEVQREFARLQLRFSFSIFSYWEYLEELEENYVKIRSGLEEKYPESEQNVRSSFIINRLMRGVLWHIHNGNAPTDLERQLECSLDSRWLSDTSTIWID